MLHKMGILKYNNFK